MARSAEEAASVLRERGGLVLRAVFPAISMSYLGDRTRLGKRLRRFSSIISAARLAFSSPLLLLPCPVQYVSPWVNAQPFFSFSLPRLLS